METVEVVIRIPRFTYDMTRANHKVIYADEEIIGQAIINGTVLPKGHGDLVDMNTVTSTYNLQGELTSYDAVVVLEADKEVENDTPT